MASAACGFVAFETCPKCMGSKYADMDQECLVCRGSGKLRFIVIEDEPEWEYHA